MSDFKGRHFEGEIVLWAVRWYCRYAIRDRDLEQMMGERGVQVDHSTIFLLGPDRRARDREAAAMAMAASALDELARG